MTKLKKDIAVVLAAAALAVAAFLVSGDPTPAAPGGAPGAGDPLAALRAEAAGEDAGAPISVRYRAEGGLSPIASFEVEARGAGECPVRYQMRGRDPVEVAHPIAEGEWRGLMAELARIEFPEVESVPRGGYHADAPTVTVALQVGDDRHEVTIDGRRRPSRDLGPILSFFDGVRRAVTPEPVESGD